MTPQHLTENIVQIADEAVPKMPLKWANIQNISIKTPESVSLPVYNKTPEVLMEIAAKAGVVEKIDEPEKEKVEKSLTTENDTSNEKKRETASPLLRALKRQKQEEKAKTGKEENPSIVMEGTSKPKKRRSTSEHSASKETATKEKSSKKAKGSNGKDEDEDKTAVMAKAEKKRESSDKKIKKAKETGESSESTKNFIAAKKFKGTKKGYVFRMGKEGLGYYVDVKPVVDQMAMDALLRSAKGKGGKRKNKNKGTRRS